MTSILSGDRSSSVQHHKVLWLIPLLLLLALFLSGCGGSGSGDAATPTTPVVTPPVVNPPVVTPDPVTPPVVTPTNKVPSALDASATLVDGASGEISLVAVDLDGDAVSYVIVSQPAHGTLGRVGGDGKVSYTPTAGYVGADSFTYKVNDGKADSAVATVKLTVKAKTDGGTTGSTNHAPVAVAGSLTVSNSGADWVKLEATDADGDTLTFRIVTEPAHGTLRLGQGNVYIYTPNSSYEGDDSFTFVANDGKVDSAAATVAVRVYTNAADSGTPQPEQISGRVLDGYLRGAKVFWDCNGNLKIDSDEISVESGAGGHYKISAAPKASCKLLANVPATAIDEDTNKPVGKSALFGALPNNPKIITPLTSLVAFDVMTEAEMKAKFSLSLSFRTDYIQAGVSGVDQHNAARLVTVALQSVDGIVRNATPAESKTSINQAVSLVLNGNYSPKSGQPLTPAQIDAAAASIPQRSTRPLLPAVNFMINPKTTANLTKDQRDFVESVLESLREIEKKYNVVSAMRVRWNELPKEIRDELGVKSVVMPNTPEIENIRLNLRAEAEKTYKQIEIARSDATGKMADVVAKNTLSMAANSTKAALDIIPATSFAGKAMLPAKSTINLKAIIDKADKIDAFKDFLGCAGANLEVIMTIEKTYNQEIDVKQVVDATVAVAKCFAQGMNENGKLGVALLSIVKSTGSILNADQKAYLEIFKAISDMISTLFEMTGASYWGGWYDATVGTFIDGQVAKAELNEVGDKAIGVMMNEMERIHKDFLERTKDYRDLFFSARIDPYIMVDVEADFDFYSSPKSTNIQAVFTPVISDEARKKGGGSIGYEWNFGDGSGISSNSNVTHTYAKTGKYNVTFTVKSVAAGNSYSLSVTKNVQIGLSDEAIRILKMRFQYPIVIPSSKRVAAKAESATASAITTEPGDCKVAGFNFGEVANTVGVIPYDVMIYNKVTGRVRGGRSCLTDTSGNVNYDYGSDWFSNMETHGVDLAEHYMVITAGHTDRCSGKQTTIRRDDITTDFDLGEITLCTSATTDTDTDGIPDVWELENGLDPKNPADAPQDKDGDGISNLDEFKGNTDPSRLVTPQNFRATASDGKVTLTWDKVAGATNYWVCHATETIKELSSCTYANGTWVKPIATNNVEIPLQNGVKYYFRMLAENDKGYASAASEEATATPGKATTGATGKLNDTGITTCSNASTNSLPCPQADFPGQDAESGRDANQATNNDADGHRGFSFTKISSTGAELPASATAWSCVKDNVTGLMWEVKTDDGGLHDKDWTYSWYEPDGSKNSGNAGTQNGGNCGATSICDTSSYVQAVNGSGGWCGMSNWRMPTVDELFGITMLDRDSSFLTAGKLAIDATYFPNSTSTLMTANWTGYEFNEYALFWSASPLAFNGDDYAWYVDFHFGGNSGYHKSKAFQVRLVSGGR
ncbi:Ig-like domain-containing protein [Thiothrix winogradskyi]|uniref:Ig-like domain-containing protein n=1 Tax=Thiothrix winogradskyi TaxID=96472 RepID=A0ABY3T311_9GAMM|nr:Ig-like domain-containing protein [Thiothrix winogradskyi]UJS25750.1 Ig-like domain-containing protein [Thiothrix winogradskyi]